MKKFLITLRFPRRKTGTSRILLAGLIAAATLIWIEPATADENATSARSDQTGKVSDAEFAVSSSTKFDFAEASIDGKMKAPEGFFLQGRQGQQMSNLMNLRSNFRRELIGSPAAAETPPR